MSKIDIIDYCGDCSKRYYDVNDLRCEPTGNKTYENAPIPGWCPLKDEKTAQADRQDLLAALELCAKAIEIIHPHLSEKEPCIAYEAYATARDAIAKHKAGKEG